MNTELVGKVLKRMTTRAYASRMAELEQLLGTSSSAEVARVGLFFGVTIGRDLELPRVIGMEMSRTLMRSHEMQWTRPFIPDEQVEVTVSLVEIIDKPDREIAVVDSLFATPQGEEIQRQRSTFVTFKPVAAVGG